MQKILRVDDTVIALFEDGSYVERKGCTNDFFKQVANCPTEEGVYALMCPEHGDKVREYQDAVDVIDSIKDSQLLTMKGDSVYWEDVSQLSMPTEFVKAVLDAEFSHDDVRIETYRNFWTLMSLNPDERCRKNLFWFLNKNGLVIARCGFFVAYRNAEYKGIDENGVEVYTDAHTHKMSIRIGEVVTMPRDACDPVQENTCSRGLHLGAQWWLKRNYYGNQGLVCLCNPADVVAVPPLDDYGKLRTCAYLPIEKAEFDEHGDVIPFKQHDGFETGYVTKVIYEGLMGTEQDSPYRIEIPEIPSINKENISDKLLDIAMKAITERQL